MPLAYNALDKFIRRSWLPFFTAIMLSLSAYTSALSQTTTGIPAEVEAMEQSVFGAVHKKLPLEARLRLLETHLLASPGKGTLPQRIKKLKAAAQSRTANLLPPLAGGLDNGLSAPVPVPSTFAAGANSKSFSQAALPSRNSPPPFAPPCTRSVPDGKTKSPETIPSKNILQEGVKQHDSGKQVDSQLAFQAVLAHDPTNIDALFNLGVLAEEEGRLQEAIDYYRTVLHNNPQDTQAQQAIAEIAEKLEENKAPFVNPLRQPQAPKLLVGRANQTDLASSQYRQQNNNIPVVNISQQQQQQQRRQQRMRQFSRVALGTALIFGASAAGLHCPACQVLRGF